MSDCFVLARLCTFRVRAEALLRVLGIIGALIMTIGFGVYSTIIIIRNPPQPYSNY